MRFANSDWRPLPRAVDKAVGDLATELHRSVASDDLFLLALTGTDGSPPARLALEAEGVTSDRLREVIRVDGDGDGVAAPPDHMMYSPAYYSTYGRADAFSVALGDGSITAEHLLLALLWDGNSHSSQLLWHLGVGRERIVERLAELGVPVPPGPLPAQHEVEMGNDVWFDRDQVQAVLDHLRLHLPPGTHWGFNYEGDRAHVSADVTVDLERLVAEALPPVVELREIDHVQLAMPAGREADAVAFYEGLLGIPQVPKPEPLAARGGCWFEQDGLRLHLGVEDDFRPARNAHPALLVRGLAGLADRLRTADVPVTGGEPLGDEARVYVDDPFGNRIELLERGGTLVGPLQDIS